MSGCKAVWQLRERHLLLALTAIDRRVNRLQSGDMEKSSGFRSLIRKTGLAGPGKSKRNRSTTNEHDIRVPNLISGAIHHSNAKWLKRLFLQGGQEVFGRHDIL